MITVTQCDFVQSYIQHIAKFSSLSSGKLLHNSKPHPHIYEFSSRMSFIFLSIIDLCSESVEIMITKVVSCKYAQRCIMNLPSILPCDCKVLSLLSSFGRKFFKQHGSDSNEMDKLTEIFLTACISMA